MKLLCHILSNIHINYESFHQNISEKMMNLFTLIIAMAVLLTLASAMEIKHFHDCGSQTGVIKRIDISPCSMEPCTLKKGSNSTISIEFQSKIFVSSGVVSVHGIKWKYPAPFPLDDSDLCHGIQSGCPLKPGSTSLYSKSVYVRPYFPSLAIVIRFELMDQNSKDLICVEFPSEISN